MTPDDVRATLTELDPDILLADGLDEAVIGHVQTFNRVVALYDRHACLSILENQGMDEEEAEEYFEFNVVGAYVGEYTPAFAVILRTANVEARVAGVEPATPDLEGPDSSS